MALTTESVLGLITGYEMYDLPPSTDMNAVRQLLVKVAQAFLGPCVGDGILKNATDRCIFDDTAKRITAPAASYPIVGKLSNYLMYMDSSMELEGTVLSSDTTWLTDSLLTQAADFWNNAWIIFTSGALAGQVRQVTDSAPGQTRLTWTTPTATAPAIGSTYVVTFFYIDGLTNSTVNYILARKGADTVRRGIVEFYATTVSAVPTGELYVAQATLSGSGVVTAYSDNPSGVDRNLWPGMGTFETLTGSGSLSSLLAGASVDVTISHDELMFMGDLNVTFTSGTISWSMLEHHRGTEFKMRVTNDGSYAAVPSYIWTRKGRRVQYAS